MEAREGGRDRSSRGGERNETGAQAGKQHDPRTIIEFAPTVVTNSD